MVAIPDSKQTPLNDKTREFVSSNHYAKTLGPPIFTSIIRDFFARKERYDRLNPFLTTLANRAIVLLSIPSY